MEVRSLLRTIPIQLESAALHYCVALPHILQKAPANISVGYGVEALEEGG